MCNVDSLLSSLSQLVILLGIVQISHKENIETEVNRERYCF